MLFSFWDKKNTITSTYLYDVIRDMKLYPVKSNCIKGSASNSGFKMASNRLNNTQGKMEIELYHSTSEIISGYVWAREDAVSPYQTQGFYLSGGLTQYQLYWGSTGSTNAVMNVSALTNNSTYKITITWNATNHSFKFNKVTRVNNVITYGPDINSTVGNVGTLFSTKDVGILCGNTGSGDGTLSFCSKHRINYFKVYDTDQNTLTACFDFSEGGGTKVYNSVTGVEYQLSNVTESLIWANKQDLNHYNFYIGHTLYTKSGSLDIRIPNKCDGTEIVPSVVPSGYTKVANYGPCLNEFNQCESQFKLDDVNPVEPPTSNLYTADYDHVLFTEGTGVAKEFDITTFDVTTGFDRGNMYINPNDEQTYFLMYGDDKTLTNDVKVIKYIGLKDEIVYQDGEVVYDANDHVILV